MTQDSPRTVGETLAALESIDAARAVRIGARGRLIPVLRTAPAPGEITAAELAAALEGAPADRRVLVEGRGVIDEIVVDGDAGETDPGGAGEVVWILGRHGRD
ncbi:MAG: hypothetical protein NW200_04805 [Hyphomonadaceae bacterium]|nr:hypothetical protein [Hyphomonadaceae bacterium]